MAITLSKGGRGMVNLYYYCKNCKVESVKDDPVAGYAVCIQCGLVNHDEYLVQSLESVECSSRAMEMPNDEHRDHWLMVMKVPATLVCKMYTELVDVKYGNVQDELIALAYLSKKEHIKFKWQQVAHALGFNVDHISKKVNRRFFNVEDSVLSILEKHKSNLKEDQYEKALKMAERARDVAREPRVIVAGILAQVTRNSRWYELLEVSMGSKRSITQDLERLDNTDEPLTKRQKGELR